MDNNAISYYVYRLDNDSIMQSDKLKTRAYNCILFLYIYIYIYIYDDCPILFPSCLRHFYDVVGDNRWINKEKLFLHTQREFVNQRWNVGILLCCYSHPTIIIISYLNSPFYSRKWRYGRYHPQKVFSKNYCSMRILFGACGIIIIDIILCAVVVAVKCFFKIEKSFCLFSVISCPVDCVCIIVHCNGETRCDTDWA